MGRVLPIPAHAATPAHQPGGHGEPHHHRDGREGPRQQHANDIAKSDDQENPNMRLVLLTIRLLSATPHKWGPKKIITVQLLL